MLCKPITTVIYVKVFAIWSWKKQIFSLILFNFQIIQRHWNPYVHRKYKEFHTLWATFLICVCKCYLVPFLNLKSSHCCYKGSFPAVLNSKSATRAMWSDGNVTLGSATCSVTSSWVGIGMIWKQESRNLVELK